MGVTLLAVSKTFDADAMRIAHTTGQRLFGESYVREGIVKIDTLANLYTGIDPVRWHLTGLSQSNETRVMAEQLDWVHSIGRLEIAEHLSTQRPDTLPPLQIYLEINTGRQASRHGLLLGFDRVLTVVQAVSALSRLQLRGLTAVPEPSDDPVVQHESFADLCALTNRLRGAGIPLGTLSMDMSADLEDVIAEGTTIVRADSVIFGMQRYAHAQIPAVSHTTTLMLDVLKLGFIGDGNMAMASIGDLTAKGAHGANVVVVDPTELAHNRTKQTWGARATAAPGVELADRDVIIPAVKPQQTRKICTQLAPHLCDSLALSVAAGIRIQDLSRWLNGHARVVRAMSNTPASSGFGMTGPVANANLPDSDRTTTSAIANIVGKSAWVPTEAQTDAVTVILGSGPAYVLCSIEATQQAAQELGLLVEGGRTLAIETFIGAAALTGQSTEPVEVLRERVTPKGGATYTVLTSMEGADIRVAFVRAMHVTAARGKEMGEELGRD